MLKVLIVEDDLMLADFAEEILVEHGYQVSGIARTVADAVALAGHSHPDLVILDLRLADGGLGTEVAAQLPPLGRPGILYVTGNMSQVALTCGDACLAKPYRAADLLTEVAGAQRDERNTKRAHLLQESIRVDVLTRRAVAEDDGDLRVQVAGVDRLTRGGKQPAGHLAASRGKPGEVQSHVGGLQPSARRSIA